MYIDVSQEQKQSYRKVDKLVGHDDIQLPSYRFQWLKIFIASALSSTLQLLNHIYSYASTSAYSTFELYVQFRQ